MRGVICERLCRPFAKAAVMLPIMMMMMMFATVTKAEKDSNPYPWGENPNNRFKMYWNNAANVYQDLDKFSSLYIKYHGCVWSECSIDSYDDDGEDRDGDENWYQYRTQTFCANAAYSLYGILKDSPGIRINSCSRRTYINSFFTYGGADTVIQALGMKAGTAFDQVGDASGHPNAVCYDVENENYYENGNNNNNNNNNNNDGSGGVSSTMGCSADGSFVVAQFSGGTCDGNYFLKTTDRLSDYNKAMNGVNCRQIWNYRKHYSGSSSSSNNNGAQRELNNNDDANSKSSYSYANPAEALLSNSWACDISVYPKGCPDPYGLKKRYDAVLQAVSSGRSSRMAVTNARLKVPLTVVSWVAVSVGIGFLFAAYFISNKLRIEKTGLLPTLCHDFKKASISCCKHSWTKFALYCTGFWTYASGAARRQRKMRRNQRREQKLKEKQSKMEEKKSRKLRRQMGSSGGTDTLQNSDSLGSPTSEDSQSPNRSSRRAISTGRASTRRGLISQTRRSSTSTGRSKSTSQRMSKLRKEQVDGAPIEQNLHRYPSGRKSWTEVSVDTSEN